MKYLIVLGLLAASCALSVSTESTATKGSLEDPIYDADGKIVSDDMSYEELMDFSDDIWYDVEHGAISPQDADTKFMEVTGFNVLDWMVANGEIAVAVDEGTVDTTREDAMSGEMITLFQTGFLPN